MNSAMWTKESAEYDSNSTSANPNNCKNDLWTIKDNGSLYFLAQTVAQPFGSDQTLI